MTFGFKGLTTQALVSSNTTSTNRNNVDIADIPAAVEGHTSHDSDSFNEKLGATRSRVAESPSDEELNKIDQSAQRGVQNVQAITQVWSRRDLILAFILYVSSSYTFRARCADTLQYMVHWLHQRLYLGLQLYSRPIRDLRLPRALLDRADQCHLLPHCRSLEAPLCKDHEHLG